MLHVTCYHVCGVRYHTKSQDSQFLQLVSDLQDEVLGGGGGGGGEVS